MMKKGMCTEQALPDKARRVQYRKFQIAFSYPQDSLFSIFPDEDRDKLMSDYDRLFRREEIWLYTTEYLAENEFQRARYLADIMGFYRAFGVEPNNERPDFLPNELEFMHYLIFKRTHAIERKTPDSNEKAGLCLDAETRFFDEHLYPAAKRIAMAITSSAANGFYKRISKEMIGFLEEEKRFLRKK